MSSVKVEYEQTISRDDAAVLLSQLARALTGDHDAEFPFGPGTVTLNVPESIRAELEVEVEGDEVEVEIEFSWPLSQRHAAGRAAAVAPATKLASRPRSQADGAGRPGQVARAKRK